MDNQTNPLGNAPEPLPYKEPGPPVRHSRAGKRSFGLAMFMVVYFFLVYSVAEPFLLAANAGWDTGMTPLRILLFFVLPAAGMIVCVVGFGIGFADLRAPDRGRDLPWMGVVINATIFLAFAVLLVLTVSILS